MVCNRGRYSFQLLKDAHYVQYEPLPDSDASDEEDEDEDEELDTDEDEERPRKRRKLDDDRVCDYLQHTSSFLSKL